MIMPPMFMLHENNVIFPVLVINDHHTDFVVEGCGAESHVNRRHSPSLAVLGSSSRSPLTSSKSQVQSPRFYEAGCLEIIATLGNLWNLDAVEDGSVPLRPHSRLGAQLPVSQ